MLPVCTGEMFLMKIHKTFYSVHSLGWKAFGKCLSCGCMTLLITYHLVTVLSCILPCW